MQAPQTVTWPKWRRHRPDRPGRQHPCCPRTSQHVLGTRRHEPLHLALREARSPRYRAVKPRGWYSGSPRLGAGSVLPLHCHVPSAQDSACRMARGLPCDAVCVPAGLVAAGQHVAATPFLDTPPITGLPDVLFPSLTLSCGVLEPCFCPESPWGGSWDTEGAHPNGLTVSSRREDAGSLPRSP